MAHLSHKRGLGWWWSAAIPLEQWHSPPRRRRLPLAAPPQQEDYHGAAATCGEVLLEDPQNPKALYRRGCARRALGQTAAALADLEAARAAAPGDGGIVRELVAAHRAAKEVCVHQCWHLADLVLGGGMAGQANAGTCVHPHSLASRMPVSSCLPMHEPAGPAGSRTAVQGLL